MNYAPQSEQTKANFEREFRESGDRSARVAEEMNRSLANSTVIEGFMGESDPQRFTAAGLPVMKFQLRHMSRQCRGDASESVESSQRQVVCDLSVLLIGKEICSKAKSIAANSLVRVEGFMTRNAYKNELSWVILEAQSIEVLCHQGYQVSQDEEAVE